MNIGMEAEMVEFKKTTSELKEEIISLTSMLYKNGDVNIIFCNKK